MKYCFRIPIFPFKGQIISKGLFVVLEFSQKTNERIRRSSKNEFVCSFFGRIRGYQKSFQNYLTFRILETEQTCWNTCVLYKTCWKSKLWSSKSESMSLLSRCETSKQLFTWKVFVTKIEFTVRYTRQITALILSK